MIDYYYGEQNIGTGFNSHESLRHLFLLVAGKFAALTVIGRRHGQLRDTPPPSHHVTVCFFFMSSGETCLAWYVTQTAHDFWLSPVECACVCVCVCVWLCVYSPQFCLQRAPRLQRNLCTCPSASFPLASPRLFLEEEKIKHLTPSCSTWSRIFFFF